MLVKFENFRTEPYTMEEFVKRLISKVKRSDLIDYFDVSIRDKSYNDYTHYPVTDDSFNIYTITKYGGSEGIYTDVYMDGFIGPGINSILFDNKLNSSNLQLERIDNLHIATAKTLDDDTEAMYTMHILGADLQLAFQELKQEEGYNFEFGDFRQVYYLNHKAFPFDKDNYSRYPRLYDDSEKDKQLMKELINKLCEEYLEVKVVDYKKRTIETYKSSYLDTCKKYINQFCLQEYGCVASYDKGLERVEIAHTDFEDGSNITAFVNFYTYSIQQEYNHQYYMLYRYENLMELANALENYSVLDFDTLVMRPEEDDEEDYIPTESERESYWKCKAFFVENDTVERMLEKGMDNIDRKTLKRAVKEFVIDNADFDSSVSYWENIDTIIRSYEEMKEVAS